MTGPNFGQYHEVHPQIQLFFFNYAHSLAIRDKRGRIDGSNRHFVRFFDDLSENVAELVSRPAGSDPGYMDGRSIDRGQSWTPELLWAIGPCPPDMPKTGTAAKYANDGLIGLFHFDQASYQVAIWRLAQRIAEIHYSRRVEPRVFQAHELRDVFKGQEA